MTMDYSPWSEREVWQFLKSSKISTTGKATPTKLCSLVHFTVLMNCGTLKTVNAKLVTFFACKEPILKLKLILALIIHLPFLCLIF